MTVPRYETCTIWSKGVRDPESGLDSAGVARVYTCEMRRGGKMKLTNSSGEEFAPRSTFWVRSGDIYDEYTHAEPQEGWFIARGDHGDVTNPASVGAEVIKGLIVHSNAKFGESDSYTIGT